MLEDQSMLTLIVRFNGSFNFLAPTLCPGASASIEYLLRANDYLPAPRAEKRIRREGYSRHWLLPVDQLCLDKDERCPDLGHD